MFKLPALKGHEKARRNLVQLSARRAERKNLLVAVCTRMLQLSVYSRGDFLAAESSTDHQRLTLNFVDNENNVIRNPQY